MRIRSNILVYHQVHIVLWLAGVLGVVLHRLLLGRGAVFRHRHGGQFPSLDRALVLTQPQHILDGTAHGQDVQTGGLKSPISLLYLMA